MIRVGLIGLPNAGKSTLFNFLTNANALVASYPFSTVTPNKANLKLYDKGADVLAKAIDAPDVMRTEVEVWDIAGLIKNASQGEGLGNEFLGQIKDCDIVIHVVRIDHTSTETNVALDMKTVLAEIALFDHKCLLKPFEKGRRMARLYPHEAEHIVMNEVLTKAYYGTQEGGPITDVLKGDELVKINDIGLISAKPRITVFNTGKEATQTAKELRGDVVGNLLELATLASLSSEDRVLLGYSDELIDAFLQDYSQQLIRKTRFKRFYTVGRLGVGQWVVPEDADAKACSQVVHADLSESIKGVRVASTANFIKQRSWQSLMKQGLVKKYGPTHIPHNEDVLYFDK